MCARLFNSSLNMKIKKNAAKAVLTPNVKTSAETISAPTPTVTAPAAPKPVTAAAAPKPPAPAASAPKPAAAAAPKTPAAVTGTATVTIDVKHDVGFGNTLFVRGQGAGLNWERGVPMQCVDGKTWRWTGKAKDPLTFKLLINDQVWSSGGDLTVKPGQRLEVKPTFS